MIDKKEVVRSYKQNPTKSQIEIIAQLNDTTWMKIYKILIESGVDVNLKKCTTGRKRKDDIGKILKRLKTLEFRCLSLPETQSQYFDEMQLLRAKVNEKFAS